MNFCKELCKEFIETMPLLLYDIFHYLVLISLHNCEKQHTSFKSEHFNSEEIKQNTFE